MKCPRCEKDLERKETPESVVVDVCSECLGTWFDEGELDQLDDSVGTSAEAMEYVAATGEHDQLACPSCGGDLKAISPADEMKIIVDRCEKCRGFWLDRGELEQIRGALLEVDSEAKEGNKLYTRPPGWSLIRWGLHCLRNS